MCGCSIYMIDILIWQYSHYIVLCLFTSIHSKKEFWMRNKSVKFLENMANEHGVKNISKEKLQKLNEDVIKGLDYDTRQFFHEQATYKNFPLLPLQHSAFLKTIPIEGNQPYKFCSEVRVNRHDPPYLLVYHNTLHPETEHIVSKQISTFCQKNKVPFTQIASDNRIDIFTPPLDENLLPIFKEKMIAANKKAKVLDWEAIGKYNQQ